MKIYTKTGDSGTTGLFNGLRVMKNHLRVDTYGTVDELNSIIGLARTFDLPEEMNDDLKKVSADLFYLGSDLATPLFPPAQFEVKRIDGAFIDWLETKIDEYDDILPPLTKFILPGGSKSAAFLHQARTVCRRAERMLITLAETEDLGQYLVIYLNRLSDYLFIAARMANYYSKVDDIVWEQ